MWTLGKTCMIIDKLLVVVYLHVSVDVRVWGNAGLLLPSNHLLHDL